MVMRVLIRKGIRIWNLCEKLSNHKVFRVSEDFYGGIPKYILKGQLK